MEINFLDLCAPPVGTTTPLCRLPARAACVCRGFARLRSFPALLFREGIHRHAAAGVWSVDAAAGDSREAEWFRSGVARRGPAWNTIIEAWSVA